MNIKKEDLPPIWGGEKTAKAKKPSTIKIIYKGSKPYGIRDHGGFLFFFSTISKYENQEERYRDELLERFKLADFLKEKLEEYEANSNE